MNWSNVNIAGTVRVIGDRVIMYLLVFTCIKNLKKIYI